MYYFSALSLCHSRAQWPPHLVSLYSHTIFDSGFFHRYRPACTFGPISLVALVVCCIIYQGDFCSTSCHEVCAMKLKKRLALRVSYRFLVKSKNRCFYWKKLCCCVVRPYLKRKAYRKFKYVVCWMLAVLWRVGLYSWLGDVGTKPLACHVL